ncbi:MAG: MerR family transcriptional regulator [bacterium]
MIAINTDKPVSISIAAEISNTTVKMLRYWEEKGYITPERVYSGSRGYRFYYPADLQKITKIKDYINQGYTLNAAARMADEEKSNNRRNI